MSDEKDLSWAQRLVDSHAWLIHVETKTLGQAAELFDGEGKKYTPPGHDRETQAPVLKFEQGHSFVAKRGAFIEITPKEARFVQDAQAMVSQTLSEIVQHGGRLQVIAQTCALLTAAILRAQLREIERMHPGVKPTPPR